MMRIVTLLLVLTLLVSGCTPFPGSGDHLTYAGPTELTIRAGKFVPGTRIQFVREDEKGAEVLIEGQKATKMVGDSLQWSGQVTDGVSLKANLRILHISPEQMITSGLITLAVAKPHPQPGRADKNRPVRYTLPVTYKVDKGSTLPGTTIRYAGTEKDKGARLEGIEGYPYRAIGDSILWEGTLRPNVDIALNVRVLFYNDSFMQVLGTATIGVTP